MSGVATNALFDTGLRAPAAPGSIIAVMIQTPGSDYLGIIRRRYLIVGLAVLVCLVLGAGYGLTRPDVFRSTSEIALPAPAARSTEAAPAVPAAPVQPTRAAL